MLAGVTGDGTELVQELPLLTSARVHVPWRQSARQVVPTGLLHRLIIIAPGRICCEAEPLVRVGQILRQRLLLGARNRGIRRTGGFEPEDNALGPLRPGP